MKLRPGTVVSGGLRSSCATRPRSPRGRGRAPRRRSGGGAGRSGRFGIEIEIPAAAVPSARRRGNRPRPGRARNVPRGRRALSPDVGQILAQRVQDETLTRALGVALLGVEGVELLVAELGEQDEAAGDVVGGEHHGSRLPTRRNRSHSADAMNRAVSQVRAMRLADSLRMSTTFRRCGRAIARSREASEVAAFESPNALAGEDDWAPPTSSTPPSPPPATTSAGDPAHVAQPPVADVRS